MTGGGFEAPGIGNADYGNPYAKAPKGETAEQHRIRENAYYQWQRTNAEASGDQNMVNQIYTKRGEVAPEVRGNLDPTQAFMNRISNAMQPWVNPQVPIIGSAAQMNTPGGREQNMVENLGIGALGGRAAEMIIPKLIQTIGMERVIGLFGPRAVQAAVRAGVRGPAGTRAAGYTSRMGNIAKTEPEVAAKMRGPSGAAPKPQAPAGPAAARPAPASPQSGLTPSQILAQRAQAAAPKPAQAAAPQAPSQTIQARPAPAEAATPPKPAAKPAPAKPAKAAPAEAPKTAATPERNDEWSEWLKKHPHPDNWDSMSKAERRAWNSDQAAKMRASRSPKTKTEKPAKSTTAREKIKTQAASTEPDVAKRRAAAEANRKALEAANPRREGETTSAYNKRIHQLGRAEKIAAKKAAAAEEPALGASTQAARRSQAKKTEATSSDKPASVPFSKFTKSKPLEGDALDAKIRADRLKEAAKKAAAEGKGHLPQTPEPAPKLSELDATATKFKKFKDHWDAKKMGTHAKMVEAWEAFSKKSQAEQDEIMQLWEGATRNRGRGSRPRS